MLVLEAAPTENVGIAERDGEASGWRFVSVDEKITTKLR